MALNDVPLSGQTLNATRQPIENNFTAINDGFKVDHVQFSVPAAGDAGKHKGIHIVDGIPSPVTAATEMGFYNSVSGGVPDLFVQKGTAGAINITSITTEGPTAGVTTTTFNLASGVIIKIGATSGSKLVGDVATAVVFPTPFPTAAYSVVITKLAIANTNQTNQIWIVNGSITAAQFQAFNRKSTSGNLDCTFIAIGN